MGLHGVYVVNEVALFQRLVQLVGVVHNRTHIQALQTRQVKFSHLDDTELFYNHQKCVAGVNIISIEKHCAVSQFSLKVQNTCM